ncbi:MAG: hypothetical protein IIB64_03910 [Proteobacteria bacterium]|nr:hypothetical protein [Pseudomonadota bacterium]
MAKKEKKSAIQLVVMGENEMVLRMQATPRNSGVHKIIIRSNQEQGGEPGANICCDGLCCDGLKSSMESQNITTEIKPAKIRRSRKVLRDFEGG